jgi:hypothetical protein
MILCVYTNSFFKNLHILSAHKITKIRTSAARSRVICFGHSCLLGTLVLCTMLRWVLLKPLLVEKQENVLRLYRLYRRIPMSFTTILIQCIQCTQYHNTDMRDHMGATLFTGTAGFFMHSNNRSHTIHGCAFA